MTEEFIERKKTKGELNKVISLFDAGGLYSIYDIAKSLNIPYYRAEQRVRYLHRKGYIKFVGFKKEQKRGVPAKLYERTKFEDNEEIRQTRSKHKPNETMNETILVIE